MLLADMLNRTIKLAMDEGRVKSYEEAKSLFAKFKLCIHVQPGFSSDPAQEAAVLTLLNAAPKTFLGGVALVGPLRERCTRAWFTGKKLSEVAQDFGVSTDATGYDEVPVIHVGAGQTGSGEFRIGIDVQDEGFVISPDRIERSHPGGGSVLAGVAAAGVALNEAFQHVYRMAPLAGQREICWEFPTGTASDINELWLVGLGHLGQAFLWTAVLAGSSHLPGIVRLTDFDTVSWSSLSTCLLVKQKDIGRLKVDVVAEQLESIGIQVHRDYKRLDPSVNTVDHGRSDDLVIIAVDNIALRRSLDQLDAKCVLEAGIGEGTDAFTRIQAHVFPGPRKARDVWIGDDPKASRAIDLTKPAYQTLLAENGDECGTTLIAGRAVATPFVGAFAGALICAFSVNRPDNCHAWSYDIRHL